MFAGYYEYDKGKLGVFYHADCGGFAVVTLRAKNDKEIDIAN